MVVSKYQDFSLHTHTTFSDGKNSVLEMALAAQELGLQALGISDHFYSIQNRLHEYVGAIKEAQSKVKIKLLIAAEIDLPWSNSIQYLKNIKCDYGFNFFIGALHEFRFNGGEYYVGDQTNITQSLEYQRKYWDLLPQLSADIFDIVAHIDIIKLSGLKTEEFFTDKINAALSAIKNGGQIIEINTKYADENQPSDYILEKIVQMNIPVVFSSDAHVKERINIRFKQETDRLRKKFEQLRFINKACGVISFLNKRRT